MIVEWNYGTANQEHPPVRGDKEKVTSNMPLWLALLKGNIHLVIDVIVRVAKLRTSRRR